MEDVERILGRGVLRAGLTGVVAAVLGAAGWYQLLRRPLPRTGEPRMSPGSADRLRSAGTAGSSRSGIRSPSCAVRCIVPI
jgi:hypothetical protein